MGPLGRVRAGDGGRMGVVLGLGIPLVILAALALGVWLVVRSGRRKQRRLAALRRYGGTRGLRYVGDDLHGRVEGPPSSGGLSIEFAVVQCSADPSADVTSRVPRMQRVETVLRMSVPGIGRRALVGRPFFRDVIHDPLRGGVPVELHDPTFETTYRVLAPPGERCEWLEPEVRAAMTALRARELRLDHGALALHLDGWDASEEQLDRAVRIMTETAARLTA